MFKGKIKIKKKQLRTAVVAAIAAALTAGDYRHGSDKCQGSAAYMAGYLQPRRK